MRLAEVCYARKGVGFWANHDYDLRTRESQRALIGQAWAQHPHSEMARATKLRPYGLHPAPNPCHDVVGLDVYQGCALPLMHITYHGVVPKLMECAFNSIQKKAGRTDGPV